MNYQYYVIPIIVVYGLASTVTCLSDLLVANLAKVNKSIFSCTSVLVQYSTLQVRMHNFKVLYIN